jgi:hypothetical protein
VLARFGTCSRPVSTFGRTPLTSLAPSTVSTIASKFNHQWTNGQVERMNRTIKEATVRRFFYATHANLRAHVATFLDP